MMPLKKFRDMENGELRMQNISLFRKRWQIAVFLLLVATGLLFWSARPPGTTTGTAVMSGHTPRESSNAQSGKPVGLTWGHAPLDMWGIQVPQGMWGTAMYWNGHLPSTMWGTSTSLNVWGGKASQASRNVQNAPLENGQSPTTMWGGSPVFTLQASFQPLVTWRQAPLGAWGEQSASQVQWGSTQPLISWAVPQGMWASSSTSWLGLRAADFLGARSERWLERICGPRSVERALGPTKWLGLHTA